MTDCCTAASCQGHPRKLRCPANGQECPEVSARTIAHHIKEAWNWQPTAARYFYCDDPDCDVAYFGDDGSSISKSRLRTRGAKEASADGLLCYCFGVSRADFLRDPAVKDFVVQRTAAGDCSCEVSNPSGRCCLKDFPKG